MSNGVGACGRGWGHMTGGGGIWQGVGAVGLCIQHMTYIIDTFLTS